MALPASDNFNRANANPLGTASGGNSWTGLENNMQVSSNTAIGTSAVAQNTIFDSTDTFSRTQFSQITITTTQDGGPIVNGSSGPNYYWFEGKSSSGSNLKKNVAGSVTTLQSGLATVANGSVLKIQQNVPGTIQIFKGGVQQGTDQADSSLTSGAAGFAAFGNGTVFDNWSADNVSGQVPYQPQYLAAPVTAQ